MKLLNKTVWAITPEMLQTMMTIARQNNKSPEAVASQLGKEMKNTNAVSIRDGVAVIRVTGPLFRYANLFTRICGATSYELFAQDFNKALKDPSVQAILLDVDSPGGEVNGCSEVADMIYKARGTKPIVAYASGYCCSGAYWIASACDKIYATDTAVIGSIGVVSIFEKDDENKTIEIVSSQSPNKRPNVETEEGKAKIQEHVDALADVFINKVALNRDISPKEVIENFGGGDVFVGQKAVTIGLADGLSSFEELVSDLNTGTYYQLIGKNGKSKNCFRTMDFSQSVVDSTHLKNSAVKKQFLPCPDGCDKNNPTTSGFFLNDEKTSFANKSLVSNDFCQHHICQLAGNTSPTEKSFMNEQKPTFSAEDIKMAERERMSQVFASELAKGKEETAQMLLAKTDMPASDILAVLGTIPTAQKSTDFEKAMASVPNPNISPSVEEQEETPDMVAARIASYTMEVK